MLAINSICVVTRSHIENSIQETHKNQIHKDEVKRRERYYFRGRENKTHTQYTGIVDCTLNSWRASESDTER